MAVNSTLIYQVIDNTIEGYFESLQLDESDQFDLLVVADQMMKLDDTRLLMINSYASGCNLEYFPELCISIFSALRELFDDNATLEDELCTKSYWHAIWTRIQYDTMQIEDAYNELTEDFSEN